MKNQPGTMKQKRYTRGVTNDLGGGRGRNEQNKQKRYTLGVTTDLGGGLGRNKQNKQKRYTRGATTDLGGGGAGITKNLTSAGSQLTF